MAQKTGFRITLGSGSRIAFAVIVLASIFAMFSAIEKTISILNITIILFSGTAYITLGTYGYDYCSKTKKGAVLFGYFFLQILLGCLIIYLGRGAGINALILLPLVGHSVVLLTERAERLVNLSIVLAYMVAVYLYSRDASAVFNSLPIFLAGAVFIMVFTQMAVNEEKARTQVEGLVAALEQANQRLRGYAVQAEELAITKERNRLAREIHDGLGHYLAAIHMQIQAARALLSSGNPQVDQTLHKAQNLAQEALVDIRQSVAALRASPGQDQPLEESLQRIPADCLDPKVVWEFTLAGQSRPLSPQSHLTIFRAAQEGLNNVRKHAQASHVWIRLDYSEPDIVSLHIQDDGTGSENMEGGFGLVGLQERAHLLGGSVNISSAKGQGFSLQVNLPG